MGTLVVGAFAWVSPTTGRPLLLVDVDGVLQPVGRSVPPGFERFTSDDSEVVLRLQHRTWLHVLEAFGAACARRDALGRRRSHTGAGPGSTLSAWDRRI